MTTYSSNTYLGAYGEKMTANANYIYSFFLGKGWSKNAICAMLGNMQIESTINPGIWENLDSGNYNGGLGLVQWTPATKLINWCEENNLSYTSITSQCKRIVYELENNEQWDTTSNYPETFKEFSKSSKSIEYLTAAFVSNYEKAGVVALDERITHAKYWFSHLEGTNFVPRLDSNGINGSPYYYDKNPFHIAGYGMPNCTTYAWGRFWEISDLNGDYSNKPKLSTRDAGRWFEYTDDGYERGSVPKLGAVACWSDDTGGAGHVAIVEQILENGDIVVSQSGWESSYFWTNTKLAENGYSYSERTFQGFIYNPFVTYVEPVGKSRKRRKYKFVLFDRKRRGIYG